MYKKLIFLFKFICDFIINIFYFNVCIYCKKKNNNENKKYVCLCKKCLDSITYLSPIKHKDTSCLIYALGKYDGVLRYILMEKYRGIDLGYYALKNNIIQMIDFFNIDFDCILPVPKTAINKLKHNINQTDLISKIIAEHYKKNIFNDIYTQRNKQDQAGKKYIERLIMKNVFFIAESKKKLLVGKKILIIDDVYTTGATIDSVLNAIFNCKVNYISIKILVLARK